MGWRSMEAKHMDRSLRVSFDPGSENDVIYPLGIRVQGWVWEVLCSSFTEELHTALLLKSCI